MGKQTVRIRILSVICVLLLAGNIGQAALYKQSINTAHGNISELQNTYPLLSKRILADNPNDILINFVPLRKQIQATFDELSVKKSFYFEYLPDGTSIRGGADQQLVAASLIKVPLAMNVYKAAELGRIDLDAPVTISESQLDGGYGELYKKGAGFRMTLRQAAKHALQDSDNTAMHVMYDHVQNLLRYEEQSLARLDIDQNLENGQAVITARSYSSVLKGLYFSAYLNKEDSQELLGYLSKSTASNRLTRDLPSTLPVAHKVGVYNQNAWAESDCGIVYVPRRPYVLCIMVGLPDDQASDFIAQVSKQVYDYVVQQ